MILITELRLVNFMKSGRGEASSLLSFSLDPNFRKFQHKKCLQALVSQTCLIRFVDVLLIFRVLIIPFLRIQRHRIVAKRGAHFTIMVVGKHTSLMRNI